MEFKINTLILKTKKNVVKNVNYEMVELYFEIGSTINELIENYNLEASQNEIIKSFSEKLSREFGEGFSVPNLKKMKKFYLTYRTGSTLWNQLSWSHNRLIMNIDDEMKYEDLSFENLNLCDKWILNRLNEVIREVDINMDKFEFVNVGSELYKFIWDDFCSWYIELTKVHLNSDNDEEKQASLNTLVYVLNAIVKMLHPFMPFVTEEIFQTIPHLEESICIASWPEVNKQFNDEKIGRAHV